MRKRVLGRGLEALISQDLRETVSETERVKELAIDRIDPNPYQPRTEFDREHLKELATSIKRHGVLQPVVVRRVGDRYQLVIGERRLRAARIAGKATIPSIVRELEQSQSLKYALLENLQREDLNPIEEARGYSTLMDEFGLTAPEISGILGKNRSTITNTVRLLTLPGQVIELISSGKLTSGHARALLSIEGDKEQLRWAERVIAEGMTVREVEQTATRKEGVKRRRGLRKIDPQIRVIEEELEIHLGSRVRITPRRKGGVISIEYYSNEELERILEKMGVEKKF